MPGSMCAWRAYRHKISTYTGAAQQQYNCRSHVSSSSCLCASSHGVYVRLAHSRRSDHDDSIFASNATIKHTWSDLTRHTKHSAEVAKAAAHFQSRFLIWFVSVRNGPHIIGKGVRSPFSTFDVPGIPGQPLPERGPSSNSLSSCNFVGSRGISWDLVRFDGLFVVFSGLSRGLGVFEGDILGLRGLSWDIRELWWV